VSTTTNMPALAGRPASRRAASGTRAGSVPDSIRQIALEALGYGCFFPQADDGTVILVNKAKQDPRVLRMWEAGMNTILGFIVVSAVEADVADPALTMKALRSYITAQLSTKNGESLNLVSRVSLLYLISSHSNYLLRITPSNQETPS
jgi:hypothetical protein